MVTAVVAEVDTLEVAAGTFQWQRRASAVAAVTWEAAHSAGAAASARLARWVPCRVEHFRSMGSPLRRRGVRRSIPWEHGRGFRGNEGCRWTPQAAREWIISW